MKGNVGSRGKHRRKVKRHRMKKRRRLNRHKKRKW